MSENDSLYGWFDANCQQCVKAFKGACSYTHGHILYFALEAQTPPALGDPAAFQQEISEWLRQAAIGWSGEKPPIL